MNINLQMNYWPAEVCNLSETVLPLIHFMDKIRPNGRITAKEMYGAKGWTMHHNTTAFGETGLHDAIQYGTLPLGGAWMCCIFGNITCLRRIKIISEISRFPS
jgi:alpha-L-fucosidase 2